MQLNLRIQKKYNLIFRFALIMFLISCIVHFVGYFTYAIGLYSLALMMPLGILWLAVILDVRFNKAKSSDFLKYSNKILFVIGICLIFYVFIAFLCNEVELNQGSAVAEGNKYFLEYKGTVIKEIDFAEYERLSLVDYRLITGHPIIFFVASATYFSYRSKMK